ncbi:hypothetical protein M885DRAFT_550318 [Pelagophyceae sp. CCMP2097]|nr:hypothetical protein M885DRAFT_550318 [Pelagophyceae sp. CCMP2097]
MRSLGVDLGTSGVRICVVDKSEAGVRIVASASKTWSDSDGAKPNVWLSALREALNDCDEAKTATRIAVSGTSASILAVDSASGAVSRDAMMYCDAVSDSVVMAKIKEHAPAGHTTLASTSSLAKVVKWHLDKPFSPTERMAHQADFVSAALQQGLTHSGDLDVAGGLSFSSDWHNSLKLGYDIADLVWPDWILRDVLEDSSCASALESLNVLRPGFHASGSEKRKVSPQAAEYWGLRAGAAITGGTTDSIAAFIACSADAEGRLLLEPGHAVTSLGSTTALKLVSKVRVDDAALGVYSHRIDDAWLVGGASNAGCRVLRHVGFGDDELSELAPKMRVDAKPMNVDGVYPLVTAGERFPVNDPQKRPKLPEPPSDRAEHLRLLLLGIADVERLGYAALAGLGATQLVKVQTAGGGSKNAPWATMRSTMLGVPVEHAKNTDAAFGAALLAARHASED